MTKVWLFSIVFLASAMGLIAGWIVGLVFATDFFLIFGGIGGTIAGAEVAYRRGLFDAAWERIIWGAPLIGFACALCLGSFSDLSAWLLAILGTVGAGIGAIIARYLLHFFDVEPPSSIL